MKLRAISLKTQITALRYQLGTIMEELKTSLIGKMIEGDSDYLFEELTLEDILEDE